MGKAEENKKLKRSALLSHAFSLFMNNGITNTSISDITEHAGVGKGTFYSYFRDKDDLIQKLIAQRAEQLVLHATEELNKHEEINGFENKIVFIADDIIEQLIADSKLHRFINKNLMLGFYKKALLNENVHYEFDFMAYYNELIENDENEWDEPLLMLYTIVELVSSTCHSIILEKDPVDYEHYKPYLFKCIRNIIQVFKRD